jgi:choloylglycine hydrolase
MRMKRLLSIIIALGMLLTMPVFACTDVQIIAKDGTVIVGRSFEWGGTLEKNKEGKDFIYSQFDWSLRAWPAGQKVTSVRPDKKPGASWTTRYAYFGFLGAMTSPSVSDGQNSEGLTMEMLNYPGYAEYQDVTPADKNVIVLDDFGSWILGNFDSVDQIKNELPKMTLWAQPIAIMQNQIPQFHFVVHDEQPRLCLDAG